MDRVVVVGAGVGGLRACEALRAAGHAGPLTVVGDEPFHPYQRPPLSKTALSSGASSGTRPAGGIELDGLLLRRRRSVADVEWRLGHRATALHLAPGTLAVTGPDGGPPATLGWDGLVIATGLRARRLRLPGPAGGRYAVRSLADARAVRAELRPGARVVVLGAGFLGCELAATATGLGCAVTVVAPEQEPMLRPLGATVGGALRARHESAGVRFRLGRFPARFEPAPGGPPDRAAVVVLDDGEALPADVVVEAVGSDPATGWLAGNGLDLTDGVLCDGWLRALPDGGTAPAHPAVVAVGDVARYPNPHTGGTPRRVEHWDLATVTARRAAPALLAGLAARAPDPEPFAPVPSFWSDQYGLTVQCFGAPELADAVEVVGGTLDGPFTAAYLRSGRPVAVVGVGTMDGVLELRSQIAAASPPAGGGDEAG